MNKYLHWAADLVALPRWTMLAVNLVIVFMIVLGLTLSAKNGHWDIVAFDAFCLGFILAAGMFTAISPGLARSLGEIEGAIMRAQMEKQLREIWIKFLKDHPEAAGNIQVNFEETRQ